ncbi:PAS domain S-box protein [Halarchaeum sp. P4]|uniref:PAS domain S-box protein n=1 Tax=Halarchaeum sp. P4 TaxID=3421639 RepID=UPI003EB79CFB
MGTPGPSSRHTLEETLDVFARTDAPGTPLTTSEVADELDCARRTAYGKLETLAERGELETKKVGARGRIWWRVPDGAGEPESALERAQFNELIETVTDYAIFVLDDEGRVQTWNDGARQLKGYTEEEIVGEHFSTFYTEEYRANDRPERNLDGAREDGRIEDEGWRVRKDGTRFWANVTITALYDDDGDVRGYIKITRDMTERHEYEERLRTQKERFETLVREVTEYAIFLLDDEGHVQTWNDGARELKGYTEEEITGEHFSAFYTEADCEAGRPERNLEQAREYGQVEDEGWRVRQDGTRFWANVTITALHDDDGEIRGYAKVTRDMTERHEYEERLRTQRDELDELAQINEVIRGIDQALVSAASRDEIESAVCERLASSETYSAAWLAEYSDDYEEVTPRTAAGISEEYLEAIEDAETTPTEMGVGAEALRTRTAKPVQDLRGDESGEPWRETSLSEGYESAVSVPLVYEDAEYGVLTVYAESETAFDQRKIDVVSELGETVSHAIAALERKERERTLTALQQTTRELLHAETPAEIGSTVVDMLTTDLALDGARVYAFDTTENTLDAVGLGHGADAHDPGPVSLEAGTDSPIWRSFVEGEAAVVSDAVPVAGGGVRDARVMPLGDHGVLAVALPSTGSLDDDTERLVELVAATTEAAFDRVESQQTLRERDELLQERNQRLQRLNQVNTLIREVDQGLVRATTRAEIQRVVCERLTESERFQFAWVGAPDDVEEELVPAARSGDARGYLDSVDLALSGVETAEPAVRALATGAATVVSNVADNLRRGQWRREAFSREFQSAIGVPLRYGDVTYGVLAVYADRPGAFDEMEQSVFGELGETIANAIHAVETKRALLGDRLVEVDVRLAEESTSLLGRLARDLDCTVAFEGMTPVADERVRVFFVVQDVAADAVQDALEESVSVDSGRIVASSEEGHLVEAVASGSTVAGALSEYGASLRSLRLSGDGIELRAELPETADVREFVEWLQSRYESAEFLARRERERPARTREGLYAELEAHLTERQREVLETAYYGGFFQTPRRSTGSDVAEMLDVSQPTVSEQLRVAQRKVLELLFDDRRDDRTT